MAVQLGTTPQTPASPSPSPGFPGCPGVQLLGANGPKPSSTSVTIHVFMRAVSNAYRFIDTSLDGRKHKPYRVSRRWFRRRALRNKNSRHRLRSTAQPLRASFDLDGSDVACRALRRRYPSSIANLCADAVGVDQHAFGCGCQREHRPAIARERAQRKCGRALFVADFRRQTARVAQPTVRTLGAGRALSERNFTPSSTAAGSEADATAGVVLSGRMLTSPAKSES